MLSVIIYLPKTKMSILTFQLYSLVSQLKAENHRLKMIADQADYFAEMYQVS